jgi:hypothetical protein
MARLRHFVCPALAAEEIDQRVDERARLLRLAFRGVRFSEAFVDLDQIVSLFAVDRAQVDDLERFQEVVQRFVASSRRTSS